MERQTSKLRTQISLILSVYLILAWSMAFYEVRRSEADMVHQSESRTTAQAHIFAEYALSNIKRLDEFILDTRSQWHGDWKSFSELIQRRQENISDIVFQVAVIDRNGLLAFSNLSKPNDRTDLSQREHFRVHADAHGIDKLFISKPLKGKVSGKWSIQFTRPIFKDGQFDGVLVISVSPELFAEFSQKLDIDNNSVMSIVRNSGEIMVRYPLLESSYGQVMKNRPYLQENAPITGNTRAVAAVDGVERIYGYYRLENYGLSFVVGESLVDVLQPHFYYRNLVVSLATAVSAFALLFFLVLNKSLAELSRVKKELLTAKDQAEVANHAKSQFLATMSHEIRTPMNGIIGMTELLLEEELSDQQRHNVEVVSNSAHSLLSIINDVLDFSKIEAGKLELELIPFNLHQLLDELRNVFAVRASAKSLLLKLTIDPELPVWVCGDPTRLRQILNNFLGNAVKFTVAGSVELAVKLSHQGDGVRFEVRDTGIGIPQNVLQSIFTPFTQGDASTTRKFGGTGLGLAISKQLTDLMGGLIGVNSEEGKGTTFWVEINLPKTEALPPVEKKSENPVFQSQVGNWSVLLVEDNKINQMVALKLLRRIGVGNIVVANDGLEALEKIKNESFAAVLMDCQMPIMDGYEATTQLRARGFDLPIIAMTANAMKGDREHCLACGMNDYISKPVSLEQLGEVLGRWCTSESQ